MHPAESILDRLSAACGRIAAARATCGWDRRAIVTGPLGGELETISARLHFPERRMSSREMSRTGRC